MPWPVAQIRGRHRHGLAGAVLLALGLGAMLPLPGSAIPRAFSGGVRNPALQGPVVVGRYEVFELLVVNNNFYANPFDFEEIELRASFTHSASGRTVEFFGFYDGDLPTLQAVNVWRLRFMPDALGAWTYTYTWSDGTPGGSGSIEVVDTGRPGLIRADPANAKLWWIQNRSSLLPYYVAVPAPYDIIGDPRLDGFLDYIEGDLGSKGVAFVLLNRVWLDCEADQDCSPSAPVFSPTNWRSLDAFLADLDARGLGANIMFYSDDGARPRFPGQSSLERLLLKYAIARLGAYPFITFDSGIDILEYRSAAWNNWYAQELLSLDPWDHRISSRHGGGSGNFTCSSCNYDSRGEVHPSYASILGIMQSATKPVLFTDRWREDYPRGNFDSESLRKIMWHSAAAGGAGFIVGGQHGALELGDYQTDLDAPVQLKAFSEFWHDKVGRWSAFAVCNAQVSNGACFAEGGQEYVVYIENGLLTTLDLSGVSGSFDVEWLNPRTGDYTQAGSVDAGAPVSLAPPAADLQDWVLHLTLSGASPPGTSTPTPTPTLTSTSTPTSTSPAPPSTSTPSRTSPPPTETSEPPPSSTPTQTRTPSKTPTRTPTPSRTATPTTAPATASPSPSSSPTPEAALDGSPTASPRAVARGGREAAATGTALAQARGTAVAIAVATRQATMDTERRADPLLELAQRSWNALTRDPVTLALVVFDLLGVMAIIALIRAWRREARAERRRRFGPRGRRRR